MNLLAIYVKKNTENCNTSHRCLQFLHTAVQKEVISRVQTGVGKHERVWHCDGVTKSRNAHTYMRQVHTTGNVVAPYIISSI